MRRAIIRKIKTAPKEPGVYIFRGSASSPQGGNKVLYVGKAANLRARLKSYLKITDIKTQSLNEEATRLECIPLRSEIEALIEESRLIQSLKPKYNILWRDDKSYLYVAITRDSMPKVFITHKSLNHKRYTLNPQLIGPFTDGGALRLVMKLLRRYFPYCTCAEIHFRECLNSQIGLCLGYCCQKVCYTSDSNYIIPKEKKWIYSKNIKAIKAILRGQSKKLLKTLKSENEKAALEKILAHRPYVIAEGIDSRKQRTFAPAAKVASLSAISRSDSEANERTERNRLRDVPANQFLPLQNINRVECYDISNLAGKEAVGAMTVLIRNEESGIKNQEWTADKNSYRKFKIKSAPTRDDPRMMHEVISRRLNHPEWPYPDLIIIDGGITQLSAARKAIFNSQFPISKQIKIISFAKPQKQVFGLKPGDEPTPLSELPKELQQLIEQAIYQTHNFVIRYHRKVRNKSFLDIRNFL